MNDNYIRGGALMLLATIFFSLSDTMAKYVTQSVPAVELASIRYAVFVAMAGVPFLRRRSASIRSRRPALQILRGIGVVGSAISFILSLKYMQITEATAINFITPLLITVLAIPVLGEIVRPQGWAAVLVGFVGMLVVVRPGVGGLHPAALLVLLSSLCWCMAMLITRRLVGLDRASVTLMWTAMTGFVLLLCALPFFLAPLTLRQLGLCLAVGVIASCGQLFSLLAYRYARATVLAPLTYAQLIWSSFFGYLVFRAVPDRWTLVGAVIIALSGTYVVHLERVRVAALRTGAI
ncbi:DMT family transporter [Acidisphaera sp. L21]|uniref:DMT family transporter n=1 Tax=Acidisphaera sp. L21 TaxID=1641851 RepID=UPI00131D738F|nr:DMT family transporter [Acidisphaera sp. L21]